MIYSVLKSSAASDVYKRQAYTYVLVHGASGGGWDWKTMDHLLTAEGHVVYRPTLTGLGEKMHLSNPDIDLTTHIMDITNVILFEGLNDVVLVGHSYGGMVITGVMNQIPGRIKHAVFLDAAAPEDGQSAQDLWGVVSESSPHEVTDGIVYFIWLDSSQPPPRDVPQSLKTLTEVRHISSTRSTTSIKPIASSGRPIAARMMVIATRLADGIPATPMDVNSATSTTVNCVVISSEIP